jgi:hypothetical protein
VEALRHAGPAGSRVAASWSRVAAWRPRRRQRGG